MTRLDGQVAVVTGGSNGIGAATVRLLAEAGATVAIGYHKGRDRAETLVDALPGSGHSTFALTLDALPAIPQVAAGVVTRHGRVDILVNAAGWTRPVPHADLDALDDVLAESMMRANAIGPLAVVRAFAPMLRASGAGVVVNISSVSAFTAQGSNIAYCGAKAALDTMTMALARALGPAIRVLCVSPGPVATDFLRGRDRSMLETMAAGTPLGRVVEPEDVARAAMACITHLTAATGIRIPVDGGSSLA